MESGISQCTPAPPKPCVSLGTLLRPGRRWPNGAETSALLFAISCSGSGLHDSQGRTAVVLSYCGGERRIQKYTVPFGHLFAQLSNLLVRYGIISW